MTRIRNLLPKLSWFRAHPKFWIFNLVLVVLAAAALIFTLTRDAPRVYRVEEQDEYVVVLDIGHGGRDPGAVVRGVPAPDGSRATIYERGMVMDVGARLMNLLEAHEHIAVLPTVTDEAGELVVATMTIPLPPPKVFLRTTPWVDLNELPTTVAVNLRWMLANTLERKWRGDAGRQVRRVVFVSLHMDELRGRAGGLTVYTPPGPYERMWPDGPGPYLQFEEARDWFEYMHDPDLPRHEVERSTELARLIVSYFERHHLRVCDEMTYRSEVQISKSLSYVPAVIRCNSIETRVLLELANIGDPTDQRLVIDPTYRERMAWAIYQAIIDVLEGQTTPAAADSANGASDTVE